MEQKIKTLYEDNHLIAVFKPAGLLVQPVQSNSADRRQKGRTLYGSRGDSSESPDLMNWVKDFLKQRDKKRGKVFLGMIHRLDRQVSGIVLFSKTSKGAARLSEQFRNHTVTKTYHALVEGRLNPPSATLTHWLRKNNKTMEAEVFTKEEQNTQKAILSYETLRSNVNCSLLIVHLLTGRFHQIRAQLSTAGYPIVGDTKYGSKIKLQNNSIALCATDLTFKTATENKTIVLSIPYPEEWQKFLI